MNSNYLYNHSKRIAQRTLVLVFIAIIFTSCYDKFYNVAYWDEERHGIEIEGKVTNIEITDRRQPLPVLNKKTKLNKKEERKQILLLDNEDIVFPDFNKDRKQMLERKIRSYFTNTGKNIKIKCDILNTVKKQIKHAFKKDEDFCLIELSIAVYNDDNKLLDFNSNSSYYDRKTSYSARNDLDILFEKVLRNAVYKCFDEMKTIKKTITFGGNYRYSLIKKKD